jgi:hypothetical protein
MDASLVVDVATGVVPERSFCFFSAVNELVLQRIARYFAFGHETPGQRRSGRTPRRCKADLARSGLSRPASHPADGLGPEKAAGVAVADGAAIVRPGRRRRSHAAGTA